MFKYLLLLSLSFFVFSQAFAANRYWVSSGGSPNWSDPLNWSATNGGTGGASVPGAADVAIFNGNGLGVCTVDIAVTLGGLTINGFTSTIDLNGNTFQITSGNADLRTGTINDGTSSVVFTINTTGSSSFRGTVFNSQVNCISGRVFLSGSTFNQITSITKNGASNDAGTGGNTFNGLIQIANSGTGYLLTGNTNPDVFNADVTISNTSTSVIYLAHNSAGNLFNENILLEATGTNTGIRFCQGGGTPSATLAATKTLSVTGAGVSSGDHRFYHFTQTGATAQSLTFTGTSYFRTSNSNWGGNMTIVSPRVLTDNSTFNGVVSLTKNGAGDDNSAGGNVFVQNCTLVNSGSGDFGMGNGSPDDFQANLDLLNSGSDRFRIALNSAGNTITGNLTYNQTGTTCRADFSENTASTLTIGGNVILNSTSTGNSSLYFGLNGDVSVTGTFEHTNSTSGASYTCYIANGANSTVTFNNTASFTNAGTGLTTQRIYVGVSGDVICNGDLTLINSTGAGNSEMRLGYNAGADNLYNSNIIVNATSATSDGIRFGENGGSGTLAAGMTITVGGSGYLAGDLRFRNFTQVGPIAQNLALTGTARIYNYDSDWGGDVNFSAPRMITRGTTYNGTSILTKNGVTDDASVGGNIFVGNSTLINSSSAYFMMGNGSPDDFQANLNIQNTGSDQFYLAYNSIGNSVGGTLDVLNSNTANRVEICDNANSSLNVIGSATFTNTSSGNFSYVIADRGDITFQNSVTLNNSGSGTNDHFYFANTTDASVVFNGALVINNNTTATNDSRSYIGNSGDVTFNGLITITNASGATNSDIYLNHNVNSTGLYNENIVLEVTNANCDGIRFGQSGGNGTLAATKTVTIGGAGYIAGDLRFRNFTQLGPTAQTLACTGTARIYNYDSNWGGDIVFSSPRILTQGTVYNLTTNLEKNGASDDASIGGNTFVGNATLVNTGSGYFMMGNGSPDDFQANLDIQNSGSDQFYLAHNSAGNTVAGVLTMLNSGTGTRVEFCDNANSTLSVGGIATLTNSSTANSTIMMAERGDISFTDNVTMNNAGTGATSNFYFASGTDASIIVDGTFDVNNTTTATTESRSYIGNNGDVTFNGPVFITNSSGATNSSIYLNLGANSTGLYNDDIVVEVTNANCDGISFGQNTGNGTLAATKTITIGGAGYISGDLWFRNFTQVGPTAQSLTCTGTARIYNYDSDWGGDIVFIAPRMLTRGTTYNGLSYLEKTSISNDQSVGGNTFVGNCQLVHTGANQFLMGNGVADVWQSNLDVTNNGTGDMYIANAALGHSVAGTLTWSHIGTAYRSYLANNTGSGLTVTGASTFFNTSSVGSGVYIGNNGTVGFLNTLGLTNTPSGAVTGSMVLASGTNSTANVTGVLTGLNNGTSTTTQTYIGNNGDVNLSSDFTVSNTGSGTNSYVYVGSGTNSAVTVDGVTNYSQSGGITRTRAFIGNNGDVTFNGELNVSNNSTSNSSEVYLNYSGNSSNAYNQNITVTSENASCDGVRFGQNGGTGTLAANRTVTVGGAGFVAGDLRFRNFNQLGGTAQNVTCTGTARIFQQTSDWSGNVVFTAPRYYTRQTLYQSDATITKNGSGNDDSYGGNTYNGATIITNSGTGRLRLSNQGGTTNDHNGDVTYIKSGSGALEPSRNNTDTYSGNINFNTNTQITLGAGGNGRVLMDGGIAQSINDLGASPNPRFRDLQINKTSDDVTLNMPIEINTELDLDQGRIFSTTTNLLIMRDNSIVSSVSNASHVDGPVEKIGNDAFEFPVGNLGVYAFCGISAPSNNSHRFRGQYFNVDPDASYSTSLKAAGIDNVSRCEYWLIDRTSGASNVVVTLSFENVRSCGITDPNELLVARWDGAEWANHLNGGTTGTAASGTINTLAPVSTFSPFTLASTTEAINPLPVELTKWDVYYNDGKVRLEWETETEINNDYFVVERSLDGIDWEKITEVDGAGNSTETISYLDYDYLPEVGINYYRLKQVDFDGQFEYFDIKSVDVPFFSDENIVVYPNPTDGVLQIEGVVLNLDEIKVYNSVGQTIQIPRSQVGQKVTLNLLNQEKGIYFVHVRNKVFKIILQ